MLSHVGKRIVKNRAVFPVGRKMYFINLEKARGCLQIQAKISHFCIINVCHAIHCMKAYKLGFLMVASDFS